MISIMLFHQPFFFGNLFVDFFHLYGQWGVDVFLFVSGFGLAHSLKKNSIPTFYKNRCKRIVPACLLVGIIKYILMRTGFKHYTHDNIFLLLTNTYLWYIYAIIVYYIFSPCIYKFIEKFRIWGLILICLLSYGFTYIPFHNSPFFLINHIGWISARLPVFVLGMYLTLHPLNMDKKVLILIGFAFFVICMGLQLGSIMVKYQWKVPYLSILLLPSIPMLCIAFTIIKKYADMMKIGFIIDYIGTYSLEFYLWHEYIYKNIAQHPLFSNLEACSQCIVALSIILLFVIITSFLVKKSTAILSLSYHSN